MAAKRIDKIAILQRLERIEYKKDESDNELEQMGLPSVLLILAEINHEKEYLLCRSIAENLLGFVPEPDEIETDEI